ncbi:isoflavone reductase family protein-like protein CipA [Trematosphaeria pertusa]|uniref:Isoflavone reductase family protein-like protein CipA n=1 Tax=Trematosphaeria pertusa TaxID=390896 RepID=A0A6A6J3U2_9PLEO|nr:isoflavone reductase family protein-like protein CipA [Trematosphaeria pertusa]KAF2257081.1 isoflavone reductase family protein-like protein CipA [Trematosphaeria pertusa]
MAEIKNVVIIGAGGNLGPSILQAFLDSSSFHITVLSREGSESTFPSGVSVLHADYSSHDSLKSAFKGQDAVLSLVGSMALADQQKLIDAAIAAGVKRFLPSEYGSDTANPKVLELVPVFQAKVGTVKYLQSKEGEISWTSVITGPFFDWGLKVGFLGLNAASKTATLIDEGKAPFVATNLRQIGLALIKVLEKPELTKNTYVYVKSFETTQQDVLAAAEKITGAKWTVNKITSKELLERGSAKLKNSDFSGVPDLIKGAVFNEAGYGKNPVGDWNEKLGLEKEDFEASIKAALNGKLYGEK